MSLQFNAAILTDEHQNRLADQAWFLFFLLKHFFLLSSMIRLNGPVPEVFCEKRARNEGFLALLQYKVAHK